MDFDELVKIIAQLELRSAVREVTSMFELPSWFTEYFTDEFNRIFLLWMNIS